jgi:hypothetical protein
MFARQGDDHQVLSEHLIQIANVSWDNEDNVHNTAAVKGATIS